MHLPQKLLLFWCATISICLASVRTWDSRKKPYLDIESALRIASLKLEGEQYYCTEISINEDEPGGDFIWMLTFYNEDGAAKVLSVKGNGMCNVESVFPSRIVQSEVLSLDDARKRIVSILQQHKIPHEVVSSKPDTITIQSNIRTYSLYTREGNGQFSGQTIDHLGPDAPGFQIVLALSPSGSSSNITLREPYWIRQDIPFNMANGGDKLQMSSLWGLEFHRKFKTQIELMKRSMGVVFDKYSGQRR